MTIKKLVFSFIGIIATVSLSGQTPTYDQAKHYQWRSMEAGPWRFRPKWYYYKWNLFSNPLGLGLHQNYINKHTPNIEQRTPTLGSTMVNDNLYETEKEKIDILKERELLLQADRTVNLIEPVMKEKINDSKERFLSNYTHYCNLAGSDDLENQGYILNEYLRIMENLSIIKDAYIENSKRQDVYVGVANDLDKLNETTVILLRFANNKNINKGFFE